MKLLLLLTILMTLNFTSCKNLFGDGASEGGGSQTYGPSGGIVTQDDKERVAQEDYQWETENNTSEIQSVYSILMSQHLYADTILGPLSDYPSIYSIFYHIQDPFSWYYDPTQAAILLEDFFTPDVKGVFGFGSYVYEDTLWVSYVFPNSPADQAGLKSGDFITKINAEPISNFSNKETAIIEATQVPTGSDLSLEVSREDALYLINMTSQEIKIPTAWADELTNGTSIIHITGFELTTLDGTESIQTIGGERDTVSGTWLEFQQALKDTEDEQFTVIDLRNNPGGAVSICMGMIDELVDSGILHIASTKNVGVMEHDTVQARSGGLGLDRQFAILANENSASCSELFIQGADANLDIPLIGTQTYGKGIAQGFYQTYYEGLVRTTQTQYFYKGGDSYHSIGHKPDYEILDPTAQVAKAIELANEVNGVGGGGSGSTYQQALKVQAKINSYPKSDKEPMAYILHHE